MNSNTIKFNGEFWQKMERDCSTVWKKGDWICVWGQADIDKEERKNWMANR
tara:strand:+ start:157 stop:309 length:153 start_codon:yes stop_codon:yes gene_type:complete